MGLLHPSEVLFPPRSCHWPKATATLGLYGVGKGHHVPPWASLGMDIEREREGGRVGEGGERQEEEREKERFLA